MSHTKNEVGMYEVLVDDHKYEFEKWGAEDASDALLDIITIVGKPLGMGAAVLFSKNEDGEKQKADPDLIGSIMEALTTNVGKNKATVKMLIKKLSSEKVLCDGAKINFNLHYKDRMSHMLKVVSSGLEVQFGNFFEELLGRSGITVPQGIMNRDFRTSPGATGAP